MQIELSESARVALGSVQCAMAMVKNSAGRVSLQECSSAAIARFIELRDQANSGISPAIECAALVPADCSKSSRDYVAHLDSRGFWIQCGAVSLHVAQVGAGVGVSAFRTGQESSGVHVAKFLVETSHLLDGGSSEGSVEVMDTFGLAERIRKDFWGATFTKQALQETITQLMDKGRDLFHEERDAYAFLMGDTSKTVAQEDLQLLMACAGESCFGIYSKTSGKFWCAEGDEPLLFSSQDSAADFIRVQQMLLHRQIGQELEVRPWKEEGGEA